MQKRKKYKRRKRKKKRKKKGNLETHAREAKGKKRKVYGPHCAGRRSSTS
jgi:hypothetical protein